MDGQLNFANYLNIVLLCLEILLNISSLNGCSCPIVLAHNNKTTCPGPSDANILKPGILVCKSNSEDLAACIYHSVA